MILATDAINTEVSAPIKTTPYEMVFGQKPRLNNPIISQLWDQGIHDEENIPENVGEENIDALNKESKLNNGKIDAGTCTNTFSALDLCKHLKTNN